MWIRKTNTDVIDKTRIWNAHGCSSYMLFNGGNTNCTINASFILRPGQWFSSPQEIPGVEDYSDVDMQFDELNNPTSVAPGAGTSPSSIAFNPGDPPPAKDSRIIIFKSYLTQV